jgi:hypothetical protein
MKLLNRGNLLWEGSRMFLPEHREQLHKQRAKAMQWKPPELSEDALAEINWKIQEAWECELPILIHYLEQNQPRQWCGWIRKLNHQEQSLQLENGSERKTILFSQIFAVELQQERKNS